MGKILYKHNEKIIIGDEKYKVDGDSGIFYYLKASGGRGSFASLYKRFNAKTQEQCADFIEKIIHKRINCDITPRFPTLEDLSDVVEILLKMEEDKITLEQALDLINNSISQYTNF